MCNLVAVFTLLLVTRTTTSVLNKCCATNQWFNTDIICEDIPKTETEHNSDLLLWIPQNNPNLSQMKEAVALKNITIQADSKPKCMDNSQDMLLHITDSVEFQLIMLNNDVFLEVLKNDTVYHSNAKGPTLFPSGSYCIDSAGDEMYAAVLCPCSDRMQCVRKCCGENEIVNVNSEGCEEAAGEIYHSWRPDVVNVEKAFYRLPLKPVECPEGWHATAKTFNMTPLDLGDFRSSLLLLEDDRIQDRISSEILPASEYCGDFSSDGEEVLHYCFTPDQETQVIETVYSVFFIVGAIALSVTVFLFLLLPDMRKNIHGKMALCHNVALLVAYLVNGVMLVGFTFTKDVCICLSFMLHFSMLAAFFWLNVMCVDIAWVFSTLRPIRGITTQTSQRRFISYSLYAWGCASVIVLITAVVEFTPGARLKPGFGTAKCFFNSSKSQLLFYFGPMMLLLATNLVLFVYTLAKIMLSKSDTHVLHTDDSEAARRKKRQDLVLYTKLFLLMGATWIFEVISWAVGGRGIYWVFTDIVNLLRGVFIFFIFCWKRTVYEQARDKLCCNAIGGATNMAATSTNDEATRATHVELVEKKKVNEQKSTDVVPG